MPEGIEDNYVDELFLKGMAHKNSFPDLHYPVMIRNTLEIVHVINSVVSQVGFFSILVNSDDEAKAENALFGLTIILSIIGYVIYSYIKIQKTGQSGVSSIFSCQFRDDIKSILFLSMILSLITPVLGSLTVAYADDTIILDYMSKLFCFLYDVCIKFLYLCT
jgi:hypothetical protein